MQTSQFEWMQQTLLECYDCHPQEDTHTVSLIVVGILKAVAILKSVSVATYINPPDYPTLKYISVPLVTYPNSYCITGIKLSGLQMFTVYRMEWKQREQSKSLKNL